VRGVEKHPDHRRRRQRDLQRLPSDGGGVRADLSQRREDIEFPEDFFERLGDEIASATLAPIWERPVLKRDAQGIHGTMFYDYAERRRHLPPSKREVDWNENAINKAQRELFRRFR
jgi:hypothetical protein